MGFTKRMPMRKVSICMSYYLAFPYRRRSEPDTRNPEPVQEDLADVVMVNQMGDDHDYQITQLTQTLHQVMEQLKKVENLRQQVEYSHHWGNSPTAQASV
ncbi:hypothetical protein AMTR_s00050p00037380 [Amborella trichopoda]|uniref:Uncharacterized protein n=1 Tax=Amborella trichopoda TaxID=13333 RepID=W1PZ69_AMBTC|nr:hypothetical protein AMTR_s00050p00037380 [Amborella trichopoda]